MTGAGVRRVLLRWGYASRSGLHGVETRPQSTTGLRGETNLSESPMFPVVADSGVTSSVCCGTVSHDAPVSDSDKTTLVVSQVHGGATGRPTQGARPEPRSGHGPRARAKRRQQARRKADGEEDNRQAGGGGSAGSAEGTGGGGGGHKPDETGTRARGCGKVHGGTRTAGKPAAKRRARARSASGARGATAGATCPPGHAGGNRAERRKGGARPETERRPTKGDAEGATDGEDTQGTAGGTGGSKGKGVCARRTTDSHATTGAGHGTNGGCHEGGSGAGQRTRACENDEGHNTPPRTGQPKRRNRSRGSGANGRRRERRRDRHLPDRQSHAERQNTAPTGTGRTGSQGRKTRRRGETRGSRQNRQRRRRHDENGRGQAGAKTNKRHKRGQDGQATKQTRQHLLETSRRTTGEI